MSSGTESVSARAGVTLRRVKGVSVCDLVSPYWSEPEWQTSPVWPGQVIRSGWSTQALGWDVPAHANAVSAAPAAAVPEGLYVLSLAILDPAGMLPSIRFATSQYWDGGRHPVGLVGVNRDGGGPLPIGFAFDNPAEDRSLYYQAP